MFFGKGSSVLIPGFDSFLLRDANSTVSRLKWGTVTVLPMNLCGAWRTPPDHLPSSSTIRCRSSNAADPSAAVLSEPLKDFCCEAYIHTYIFINPRSHVTIQDAKTVSGEIEKEAKKETKLNYFQQINIYIALQYDMVPSSWRIFYMGSHERVVCLGLDILAASWKIST